MNMKIGQYVLGNKKIRMSMCQQVPDDVIVISSDISEKGTSLEAMNMKTEISMGQQVLYDIIMVLGDISEKHISKDAMNMEVGEQI